MAKEVVKKIKLQIVAGKATPAPPVGTVLGPAGINLQEFCTKYNDATREKMGDVLPVEISIYDDRSFDFVIKTEKTIYAIETNFYASNGSKLNETARSYKMITEDRLRQTFSEGGALEIYQEVKACGDFLGFAHRYAFSQDYRVARSALWGLTKTSKEELSQLQVILDEFIDQAMRTS